MSAAASIIPDPGGGGELKEDQRPIESEAKRRGKERWAKMTDAEKAAQNEKAAEGRRRAKEAREGKRGGDSAPKSKGPSAAARQDSKADDLALIRDFLSTILVAPSAIGAVTADPWLTGHFVEQGPQLANAIVDEASRNDAFRAYLIKIAKAARGVSLIGALAMYLAPPLMHYGVLPGAAMLGVPVKDVPVGPGEQRPVPGSVPHFVAPERGPAEAPPVSRETPPQWVEDMNLTVEAADDLAAELRDHEDAGGMTPPLPMEPV